jgi:hypothetical protein
VSYIKKTIIITILFFQFFGNLTLLSQSEKNNCQNLTDLKPLDPEVKESIIKYIKEYISQSESEHKEGRIITVYCPPTELYFDEDCDFPKKYENINFYLALLYVKPNSKLVLQSHSDRIDYEKNPEFNIIRGETVKKIFMYFGIDPNRIKIEDIKDERPIASNETEEGRMLNRYVGMNVTW